MTAIIDLPNCVVLFTDLVDHRTQFLVMLIRDGLPAAMPTDPAEFLYYMGGSYEEAILIAEALATANGDQVDDRVGRLAEEFQK